MPTLRRTSRAERVARILRHHAPSLTFQSRRCLCGYPVAEDESIAEHQGRIVVQELFGVRCEDTAVAVEYPVHQPNAYQVMMHRARKEELCTVCNEWVRSL